MALIKCTECSKDVSDKATTCPHCGISVNEMLTSSTIAQPIQPTQPVLMAVQTPQHTGNGKNKWASFFLCFFLGSFGAHKFYEQKYGIARTYLAITIAFFSAIILGAFYIEWLDYFSITIPTFITFIRAIFIIVILFFKLFYS